MASPPSDDLMAAIACCDLDRLHSLLSDDTFDLEAPWSAPPGGVRYRGPPMLLVGAEHLRVEGVLNPGEPWTPLLLACDKGHASVVEVLLRHGVAATSRDVLGVGGQGGTLPMLFYALNSSDNGQFTDCALALLRAGAQPLLNYQIGSGATALQFACQYNRSAAVRFLIMNGADLNLARTSGATPLYAAAQNGYIDCCRLLIGARAAVDRPRTASGATPLFIAAAEGHVHCVELLLAARASVHHVAGDGHTPTTLARVMRAERPELGHVFGKVIALLRAEDSFGAADHDGGSLPPGLCATVVGLQAASELNGRVARVLSFDEGRGRYGVQVGTPTGVRRLSIRPANLRTEPPELPGGGAGNQLPQPPIRAAELALVLRSGQSRWFGELVRQTSRTELAQLVTLPGVSGEVPLLHSTLMVHVAGNRHASEECARALVEAGADVNVRCQIGANGPVVTPLRLACESGNVGACRLLLDAKADVSPEDLVQIAGKDAEGVRSCMRLLLEHGAPIDATDAFEYTALLAAAEWGRTESVKLLLELRASPHSTCPAEGEGYDCLIAAVQNAMPDVVRVLLDAGVDPSGSEWTCAAKGIHETGPLALAELHLRQRRHDDARLARYARIAELLQPSPLDKLMEKGLAAGVLTQAEVDEGTDALARGDTTEDDLLSYWEWRVEEEQFRQSMRAARGRQLYEGFAEAVLRGEPAAVAEALRKEAEFEAGGLLPLGSPPVYGGRARLVGLQKEPALNGQIGVIVSFNDNGGRRFCVELPAGGGGGARALRVSPHNLEPVDSAVSEYPSRVGAPHASVLGALRADLARDGPLARELLDWTPLSEDPAIDQGDLYQQLMNTVMADALQRDGGPRRAFYVQRTGRNEAFFLTHRELQYGDAEVFTEGGGYSTAPWLVFNAVGGSCIAPPVWKHGCEPGYMARLLRSSLDPNVECTVCLEAIEFKRNPSQLPCMHIMCTTCLKKLYGGQSRSAGLTCPSCKDHFPNYALLQRHSSPGGVVLAENTAGPFTDRRPDPVDEALERANRGVLLAPLPAGDSIPIDANLLAVQMAGRERWGQ